MKREMKRVKTAVIVFLLVLICLAFVGNLATNNLSIAINTINQLDVLDVLDHESCTSTQFCVSKDIVTNLVQNLFNACKNRHCHV